MSAPLFAEPIEGEVIDLPAAGPQTVTERCDVCDQTFTGPAGGKGSAPMLLGKHRWSVHRLRKGDPASAAARPAPGKPRAGGKAEPVDVAGEAHPIVAAVHGAASQVGGKTAPPRAADLAKALGYGLSAATSAAARWAVDSDPIIKASADPAAPEMRDALVQALSVTRESAERIAAPFARVLAPTELNKRIGRAVVDNSDLAPALAELVDVGRQWSEFLALRREHVRLLRAAQQPQQPGAGPTPTAPAPGAPTGPPMPGQGTAGLIATPTYRTH